MEDLSELAVDSMWVTSQGGGNVTTQRPAAMSAPGSAPVNPRQPPDSVYPEPHIQASPPIPQIPPGATGKPAPRTVTSWNPPAPAWGKTGTPDVTRVPEPGVTESEPQPEVFRN